MLGSGGGGGGGLWCLLGLLVCRPLLACWPAVCSMQRAHRLAWDEEEEEEVVEEEEFVRRWDRAKCQSTLPAPVPSAF